MLNFQVAKNILTDVEFDMESLASGIESEPVQENMKGINQWIQSTNKKKKKMSKRDRKKSSSAGLSGRGHQVSHQKSISFIFLKKLKITMLNHVISLYMARSIVLATSWCC